MQRAVVESNFPGARVRAPKDVIVGEDETVAGDEDARAHATEDAGSTALALGRGHLEVTANGDERREPAGGERVKRERRWCGGRRR